MTDRDALLAAIRAEPAEDTPRLVFADWLDEHGDDAGPPWAVAPPLRAAFIRTQVEQARCEPHSPDARQAATMAAKLLRPFKSRWASHLPRAVINGDFSRGFIERVNIDAAAFPAVAGTLFDAEPVRAVRVTRFRTSVGRVPLDPLLDLSRLSRVEELDLSSQDLTDDQLQKVFRSEALASLRSLSLKHNAVTSKGLAGCLTSTTLPQLTALDLTDNPQLHAGLAACWPVLGHRRFRSLDLSRVRLTHPEVAALVGSACADGLEEFRLAAPPNMPGDGPETAAAIATAPGLRALRVLDLAGVMIGDSGAERLAKSPHLKRLRVLNLAANGLGTPTVKALLRVAPWDLFELNLRFNSVGVADAAALRSRFPNATVVA